MIIVENLNSNYNIIEEKESEDAPSSFFIEGVFMQAEVKNGNSRVYPLDVLKEAVDVYNQDYVQLNRGYGELGHPTTPGINLERVCVLTQSLQQDGNNFIGKAKVIDTPYGKIVKEFIREGVSLGVSSRGVGRLGSDGKVSKGFRLKAAIDVVADPSAPDAFVNAIMEQRESLVESVGEQEFEQLREEIQTCSSRHLAEKKASVMKQFFEKIATK